MASEAPDIRLREDGTAQLSGKFTFGTVPAVYDAWRALAARTSRADLQHVTELDSAGLALLLEWSALLRDENRRLAVHNAPESLIGIAALCDAGEWLLIEGRATS